MKRLVEKGQQHSESRSHQNKNRQPRRKFAAMVRECARISPESDAGIGGLRQGEIHQTNMPGVSQVNALSWRMWTGRIISLKAIRAIAG